MAMDLLRRIGHCRSGAMAVEFAIVGMVFVLLSIGIVEFGRGLHLRNQIAYAADVGARRVLINPASPDDELDGVIRSAFTQGDSTLLQIEINSELAGGVSCRVIVIRYPLTLLVPGLMPSSVTLSLGRRVPLL